MTTDDDICHNQLDSGKIQEFTCEDINNASDFVGRCFYSKHEYVLTSSIHYVNDLVHELLL